MSETDPMSLATFLLARYDEEEALAVTEWPKNVGPHLSRCAVTLPDHAFGLGEAPWCDCGYPARVLADVAAKRAIVKEYVGLGESSSLSDRLVLPSVRAAMERVLRHLATPHKDHPDYDPAWEVT